MDLGALDWIWVLWAWVWVVWAWIWVSWAWIWVPGVGTWVQRRGGKTTVFIGPNGLLGGLGAAGPDSDLPMAQFDSLFT